MNNGESLSPQRRRAVIWIPRTENTSEGIMQLTGSRVLWTHRKPSLDMDFMPNCSSLLNNLKEQYHRWHMRDSLPKVLKKFAKFFKGVFGGWISYTMKAIRGHFSEPNILWRSDTNSLFFRCCSLVLFFFDFVVLKGIWSCVTNTMWSCDGHRAGSGQIVIQSPQESIKEEQSKYQYSMYNEEKLFNMRIHEKFDVWCNQSASCFTITKDRSPSSYFISSELL